MTNFNFKKWNNLLGWAVFAIALITYTLTVEPTMSFWDCGEYIATSAKLEVGHPPGAPLFQMIGAFFAMFAISKQHIAFMVNMTSVVSSAFTILFMFWSSTMILKKVVAHYSELSKNNLIAILGSSFVGALTFTFTDSFWFNATEAEVYAMAMLFMALMLWLGLRWEEDMHTPKGNKWLLLISLVTGLSFGVHFMALLTIPSIGFLYYFKNYKKVTVTSFIIANVIIVAILLFIFKLLLPYTLAFFGKTEIFMVNNLGLPFNSGSIFGLLLIVVVFYFGLLYTKKKQHPFYNTMLLSILFLPASVSGLPSLNLRVTDSDPYPDYMDIDSDDDGIPDNVEAQATAAYKLPVNTDTDGDGLINTYDNVVGFGGSGLMVYDHDGDGTPDYRDLDTDGDGQPDIVEGNDFNLNGVADDNITPTGIDTDSDGLDNRFDSLNSTINIKGTSYRMGTGGTYAGDSPPGSKTTVQKKFAYQIDRDWRYVGVVLPVQFLNFTGVQNNKSVLLTWTIITEGNSKAGRQK